MPNTPGLPHPSSRSLALSAALLAAFVVGLSLGIFSVLEFRSSGRTVDVYVDRTPAPQEPEIRRAAQALLDDFNAHDWQAAHNDFASSCRGDSSEPEAMATGWAGEGDFHLELRDFRVTEIHDNTALVNARVFIVKPNYESPYGPNHGADPFIRSFTKEGDKWRAC